MKTRRNVRIVLFIIALIGLILSLYLVKEYYSDEILPCPVSKVNTCETVKDSEYSIFLGVKLPVWGSLYFLSILFALSLFLFEKQWSKLFPLERVRNSKNRIVLSLNTLLTKSFYDLGLFILVLWGAVFEGYLTYVQLYKIEAVCTWCFTIEILVSSMFLINTVEFLYFRRKAST
jgi:uncharacterized membrane protein